MNRQTRLKPFAVLAAALSLAACGDAFDADLRGLGGGFSTANAAQAARTDRPEPDARGIISYPTYQVAIAQRGDTVQSIADRVGLQADSLARFNGLTAEVPLREGEVIALPTRVAESAPAVNQTATAPAAAGTVDVERLAGEAIETAELPPAPTPPAPEPVAAPDLGPEPIRHKVVRGETAYSVSRLYRVSVRDLARWNALGPQFTVREGQFLLIPVAAAQVPVAQETETVPAPGQGTPTPTPPSAAQPLPPETITAAALPDAPAPDLGAQTQPVAAGAFAYPVQGTIIRDYAKGRNDGINIKGTPGAAVTSAAAGTVAAITESAEGVPIIVVRHEDNLLTVYANVTDVLVQKGETVRRGQGLAKLRDGDQSFVHFEVRQGFESVDPNSYLN